MPIVFVHGVNNRVGDGYQESLEARNGFIREIVAPALRLKSEDLVIFNPYWGEFAVNFAWNMASLPNRSLKFESFGSENDITENRIMNHLFELGIDDKNIKLSEFTKNHFQEVVDVAFSEAMVKVDNEEDAKELAKTYVEVSKYIESNPKPLWLEKAVDDNLIDTLIYEASEFSVESFGGIQISESIKEGFSRIKDSIPDIVSGILGKVKREKINSSLTRFTGDAFVYFNSRGDKQFPGKIINAVINDLEKAFIKKSDSDKLIVIAHSFGGEIIYDILTYYRPDIEIDYLVTVGSQVGLFEEMKLFKNSDIGIKHKSNVAKVTKPVNIKKWINVFDHNDVVSYLTEPIFSDVIDFEYDTGYGTLSAHGGYFSRPSFYKRLADRLIKD